jgi:hypothetical protein
MTTENSDNAPTAEAAAATDSVQIVVRGPNGEIRQEANA